MNVGKCLCNTRRCSLVVLLSLSRAATSAGWDDIFLPGMRFSFCPRGDRFGQLMRKRTVKCKEKEGPCSQGCSHKPSHGGSKDGSLLGWQHWAQNSATGTFYTKRRDLTAWSLDTTLKFKKGRKATGGQLCYRKLWVGGNLLCEVLLQIRNIHFPCWIYLLSRINWSLSWPCKYKSKW